MSAMFKSQTNRGAATDRGTGYENHESDVRVGVRVLVASPVCCTVAQEEK